jgi:site-specific DNA-adenine methylase
MKNKHNELLGSDIERSDERIDSTGEVFTPLELCQQMIDEIPEEQLRNPDSKFIDPAAGNGNFLISLKNKLLNYHTEAHILDKMLYAVELMEDNHKEMCERLGVSVDHPHYVQSDALTYHYAFNGRTSEPITLDLFETDENH